MAKLEKVYANALLEISKEKGTLETDLKEAILVRDTLIDKEIHNFITHPSVSDSAKKQLIKKAFSDNVSKDLIGFLYLMIRKNRERIIIPVLTEYINLLNRSLGIINAKVVSAKELTENQIESISTILSKKLGMNVIIEAKVDPEVIGGFYVLVEGRIFDYTIRSQLNKMKQLLKRGSCYDN